MSETQIPHVTKDIAVRYSSSVSGAVFYHRTLRDKKDNALYCRVNGKCKVWKTRPDEFRLPVKHGWKDCFYITERTAHDWLLRDPTSLEVILEPFLTSEVIELAKATIEDERLAWPLADALADAGYNDQTPRLKLKDLRRRHLTQKIRIIVYLHIVQRDTVSYCATYLDKRLNRVITPCESLDCPMHGERNRQNQNATVEEVSHVG